MSYYEQAEKINSRLIDAGIKEFDEITKEKLINAILWFGQVAKFRCRSNSAYDNFSQLVFKEIGKLARKPLFDGSDFDVLQYIGVD